MRAMILAAGRGTRLLPYTTLRPKPLFPVLDRPVLFHACQALAEAGASEIIVNCYYLAEQIMAAVAPHPQIITSAEDMELGTGGGLRQAAHLFGDEPLLLVNGDIFHTIDLAALWHQHQKGGAAATLVLHDCPRFNKVSVASDDTIMAFTPQEDAQRTLAFTGIQVVDPGLLATIPPRTFFNMIDCYSQAIARGEQIAAQVVSGHFWTDMGTPADYLDLHGQLLTDPRFAPNSPIFKGAGVRCDAADLHDWVSIGSGATIGKGARLSRVVVWDGAKVPSGAVLTDTIVTS
ncbi:MAG: sugar phosphate nucleotidyltransferase [Thermodesulfobacteriota bacterium]